MYVVCLDLEGVLVPEIWIAFAEASGIPELKRTTRDEPDYDKLMQSVAMNMVVPIVIPVGNRVKWISYGIDKYAKWMAVPLPWMLR